LAGTLVYAVDVFNFLQMADPRFIGKLSGDGMYTQNPTIRTMFLYLSEQPYGIILENQYADFYSDGGVYGAFSAKPIVMGWPKHLITWRGRSDEIELRKHQLHSFYDGTLLKPNDWLRDQNVRYIIWNENDTQHPEAWLRYSEELKPNYAWNEFGVLDGHPVGIWSKRD
jgi:hypothetical protein